MAFWTPLVQYSTVQVEDEDEDEDEEKEEEEKEEEEEEEERNIKILSTFSNVIFLLWTKEIGVNKWFLFIFSGVYKHKIFNVYKHLIFVVYKHQYYCVYKRSIMGSFQRFLEQKKNGSNLQIFELFNRTFSSLGFFSLYWSGQTISFFPSFINGNKSRL